jgi:hypothetical protein
VEFLLSKSFETYTQKQLEDTKGVIRSHNSKNRQYNGPKKNIKGRTSLISNFATFSVLELCPLIYLIGLKRGHPYPMYTFPELRLGGDSSDEVALWMLTLLCSSAKREVEVALKFYQVALLILTVKKHRYIFTTKFPFFKPPL